jgi:hypothetical protein
MRYGECRCGALLRLAKVWVVLKCGSCGFVGAGRDFVLELVSESSRMNERRSAGIRPPTPRLTTSTRKWLNMASDPSYRSRGAQV